MYMYMYVQYRERDDGLSIIKMHAISSTQTVGAKSYSDIHIHSQRGRAALS